MKPLIHDAFLGRLATFRLATRGRRNGLLAGSHASRRAGVSLEFRDYRSYFPGDDFRYIDWNAFGRLDRLLVRSFVHESDMPVYVIVDLSASMSLGVPSKADYAAGLAAALSYIGLRGLDRVGLYLFSKNLHATLPPSRGLAQMSRILKRLRADEPRGQTSMDDAMEQFVAGAREPGLVILISDFFAQRGRERALDCLLRHGHEVVAVQVLAPEEVDPKVEGRTQFVDIETGRNFTLSVGAQTLEEYRARFASSQAELANAFRCRSILCFEVATDRPLARLFHEDFRARGLIR
jgi:uncharacterized protein (DUF58 family)